MQEHNHRPTRRYRKIQTTKKLGCPAHIYVQEIVKFPTFAVSMGSTMSFVCAIGLCPLYLAAAGYNRLVS